MSKRRLSKSGSARAAGLNIHLQAFLATVDTTGYSRSAWYRKRSTLERFIQWTKRARLAVADLDEMRVSEFLARRDGETRKMERTTLDQFLAHLRTVGAVSMPIPPPCATEPSPAEGLLQEYVEHLRNDRGLCDRSVEVYTPYARAFVDALRLPESAVSLDASAVRTYLLDRSRNRSNSSVKLLAAALRSFLRFLFFDGMTQRDLSKAVPPVRRWQLADVPPFLTPEEVERVIAVPDRSTASGCRAHAMLLLLARLGLRAGEVAALELDDIHWDVGEIVVRGKDRRRDRLPLLEDVGEALARYLRDVRGPSSSRHVFLRRCAPHVGLSGPTAVCLVARQALRRAGLLPDGIEGIFRMWVRPENRLASKLRRR
jgi:site-specific recombinase XerD